MSYLNLWSSLNWVIPVGESWKSLLPIFLMLHWTDFGGFLVRCYKAIQQLNGVEKKYVAISLMLNHNLTGLNLGRLGNSKIPDRLGFSRYMKTRLYTF